MPDDQFDPVNFVKGGQDVEPDLRTTFPADDNGYDDAGYAIHLAVNHEGYLPTLESAASNYPLGAELPADDFVVYAGFVMGMSLAHARHFEHTATEIRGGLNAILKARPELRAQYERAVCKGYNG